MRAQEMAELLEWLDRVITEGNAWADKIDPKRTYKGELPVKLDGIVSACKWACYSVPGWDGFK